MARFRYEAKKGPEEIVKDVLVADNKTAAIQKIGQMGYYILSLTEEGPVTEGSPENKNTFFGKVTLKDMTDFTRQLSDLIESGMTIVKALDILHKQTTNKKLKSVIVDVRDACVGGSPFSEALARHPKIFSHLYVNMVKSGETGGALENILKRLSDFNEKQLEIRTKIRTAMAYPILMCVVGIGTMLVLMTFVIPKMMTMFTDLGQALPLPTQILLLISSIFKDYWWMVALGCFGTWALFAKVYATAEGRLAIDRAALKIPLFGPLGLKVEIARFSRTLATLLENGVPILESLRLASETVGNAGIRQEVEKAYDAVCEGSSLTNSFTDSSVMPAVMVNMIAIGEESGHLEKSLLKVAQSFERESDEAIKIMMSLLEPLLILVLGMVLGFIVISMLLPIFEINFMMK